MGSGHRLAVALDVGSPEDARDLAHGLSGTVDVLKVGLELFIASGPDLVGTLAQAAPVFLDLKLHDIPNTMAGGVRSAAK
ncbi:MAG: orotidine 5'-phosphate decarboxylase, partial [Myxococcales bacterium]|nr:orotidine 5'-phosphate decarboxylase [Myxococcales bacterium]